MQAITPILETLSEVQPRPIEWLWGGRIAAGRITLVAGDPGLGKSWLTLDIASRVATGSDWPDGQPCKQGSVVLMNCEDDLGDTVAPRLSLLGADLSQVHALTGVMIGDEAHPVTLEHHQVIRTVLQVTQCRLLIIDPISAYFGSGADSNRDTYIRSAFRPLAETAEACGTAVLLVAHLNKSSEQSALYRFSGSVQFSGAARTAYYVGRDRADQGRRLMMCVKNNIGRDRWALAYRVDPEHTHSPMQWEPDEISSENLEDIVTGSREPEDVREIADWLRHRVDTDRGVPVGLLQKEIKSAGWSWQMAVRARRVEGIEVQQINGEWYWLPKGHDPTMGRGWSEADEV